MYIGAVSRAKESASQPKKRSAPLFYVIVCDGLGKGGEVRERFHSCFLLLLPNIYMCKQCNQAKSYLLLNFSLSLSHRFFSSLFSPISRCIRIACKTFSCVATQATRHHGGARTNTIGSFMKASTPHQHSTASSFIKIFCFLSIVLQLYSRICADKIGKRSERAFSS